MSGTTGLKLSHKKALKQAGKNHSCFYGENMSGGIFLITNWLKNLINEEAQALIEDVHHNNKKDKPSGTALRLKKNLPVFLRKKTKIKSIRKGKEFGTHRITLKSPEELLILEHPGFKQRAFCQRGFAGFAVHFQKEKGLL